MKISNLKTEKQKMQSQVSIVSIVSPVSGNSVNSELTERSLDLRQQQQQQQQPAAATKSNRNSNSSSTNESIHNQTSSSLKVSEPAAPNPSYSRPTVLFISPVGESIYHILQKVKNYINIKLFLLVDSFAKHRNLIHEIYKLLPPDCIVMKDSEFMFMENMPESGTKRLLEFIAEMDTGVEARATAADMNNRSDDNKKKDDNDNSNQQQQQQQYDTDEGDEENEKDAVHNLHGIIFHVPLPTATRRMSSSTDMSNALIKCMQDLRTHHTHHESIIHQHHSNSIVSLIPIEENDKWLKENAHYNYHPIQYKDVRCVLVSVVCCCSFSDCVLLLFRVIIFLFCFHL